MTVRDNCIFKTAFTRAYMYAYTCTTDAYDRGVARGGNRWRHGPLIVD